MNGAASCTRASISLNCAAPLGTIQGAPLQRVELVDTVVMPLRVEGVGPLRIDGSEPDELIGVDRVRSRVAQRHLVVAGFGGAELGCPSMVCSSTSTPIFFSAS